MLMIKYQPRIYSALYGYVKSKEDAEDLTQQVFIRTWNKIDSFRGESAFFTWLYRVAINIAKNHVTSASFKKQKLNTSDDIIDFDYPNLFYNHWHTQNDIPENCSPQSLAQVGTLLVNYIYGKTN